jgi:hypothetical protein
MIKMRPNHVLHVSDAYVVYNCIGLVNAAEEFYFILV